MSKYTLNFDNIMYFVFGNNSDGKETEITDYYIRDEEKDKLVINTKQLREVNGSGTDPRATIRYDYIKMLTDFLLGIDNADISTFGEELVLNTLRRYGMINDENDVDENE